MLAVLADKLLRACRFQLDLVLGREGVTNGMNERHGSSPGDWGVGMCIHYLMYC